MGHLPVLIQALAAITTILSVAAFHQQPQMCRLPSTMNAVSLRRKSAKILIPVGLVDVSKLFEEQKQELPHSHDAFEYLQALKQAGKEDKRLQ